MPNNRYKLNSQNEDISWLNSNLFLSSSLFLCTYLIFGWLIASNALFWADLLHEQNVSLQVGLEDDLLLSLIKFLAVITIILITLALSTPIALTTFLFTKSINSDFKGLFSLLLWSIVLVFAFCYFGYFADFLVIVSANILLRLDLKKLKLSQWQIMLITIVFSVLAFITGMILFDLLAT